MKDDDTNYELLVHENISLHQPEAREVAGYTPSIQHNCHRATAKQVMLSQHKHDSGSNMPGKPGGGVFAASPAAPAAALSGPLVAPLSPSVAAMQGSTRQLSLMHGKSCFQHFLQLPACKWLTLVQWAEGGFSVDTCQRLDRLQDAVVVAAVARMATSRAADELLGGHVLHASQTSMHHLTAHSGVHKGTPMVKALLVKTVVHYSVARACSILHRVAYAHTHAGKAENKRAQTCSAGGRSFRRRLWPAVSLTCAASSLARTPSGGVASACPS